MTDTIRARQNRRVTDFGGIEYPWPREGDDPFALNNDARLIARLNLSHDVPWRPYAEGFKRLADLVVQQIAEVPETGADRHFLVFPIFFNYRHYIELSLKLIIEMARDLLDRQDELPKTHNLTALWEIAEPLLIEIDNREGKTHEAVRESLERFTAMDPVSESFRYPVTKRGDPTLPSKLSQLDLGQLRDVVERLSGFFDGASEQIHVYRDWKLEMAQEFDPGDA